MTKKKTAKKTPRKKTPGTTTPPSAAAAIDADNLDTPTNHIVDVTPARCPRASCRSTEREPYRHVVTRPIAGVTRGGLEYTQVVWRRTRCRACGQIRVDKFRENVIGPPKTEGPPQTAKLAAIAGPPAASGGQARPQTPRR